MNKNILNQYSPGYLAVHRLDREYPDWITVVMICLKEAKRVKGDFAGSWVLNELKRQGLKWKGKNWFPNLRILVSFGILQKTDVSRGGRRAYYIMPDIEGVEKALGELNRHEQ